MMLPALAIFARHESRIILPVTKFSPYFIFNSSMMAVRNFWIAFMAISYPVTVVIRPSSDSIL
jgi:hypothetical protein